MNFAVSCKSFIVSDGKLLIIKRMPNDVHKPGVWEIPGGRMDLGESPFRGLPREVKEEVGLDIKVCQPLAVRHFVREDGQNITMLVFLCQPLNREVKLSQEHTEHEWIPVERAKEKLHRFFHSEINNYLRYYN